MYSFFFLHRVICKVSDSTDAVPANKIYRLKKLFNGVGQRTNAELSKAEQIVGWRRSDKVVDIALLGRQP